MRNILLIPIATLVFLVSCSSVDSKNETVSSDETTVHCNADSLLAFVKAQTDFGARVPNSVAHDSCVAYLENEFKRLGAEVELQRADLKAHDGTILHSTNIIASFNRSNPNRIFIASHYDSRPWCDKEALKEDAAKPVMGANDGASGVAVLLELARLISKDSAFTAGVDLICFDSEDYGVGQAENSFCLGSQYWAEQTHNNGYKARYGILLDMVGDPAARFYRERVSDYFAKDVVDKVWSSAAKAGYSGLFVDEEGGGITDDHYYVNTIAGIPCIDIIDYIPGRGFPDTWHTTRDVTENISKETLKAVCTVIGELVNW